MTRKTVSLGDGKLLSVIKSMFLAYNKCRNVDVWLKAKTGRRAVCLLTAYVLTSNRQEGKSLTAKNSAGWALSWKEGDLLLSPADAA